MNIEDKIKQLIQKRTEYQEKLDNMYKTFRGVSHENAAAEMKYTQIRVYEDFIRSITDELKVMGYIEDTKK